MSVSNGESRLFEQLLEAPAEPAAPRLPPPGGLTIGVFHGFSAGGETLVSFANGARPPIPARSVIPLTTADEGVDVVLGFENCDPTRPLVLGRVWLPEAPPSNPDGNVHVEADGERVVISAEREIVLQCGDASITLTRAGKVLIRGTYVLSRSSGVNRVKGGSVQIN